MEKKERKMQKINKCEICNRELGNHSGGIFIQTGTNEIMHPTGFYIITCIECYISYISQYLLSNKETNDYINRMLI